MNRLFREQAMYNDEPYDVLIVGAGLRLARQLLLAQDGQAGAVILEARG